MKNRRNIRSWVALFVTIAFAAAAQSGPEGIRLRKDDIARLFAGASLYGEYTEGRPDWAEETAVTGELYDAAENWNEVGRWGTSGDYVCYTYWHNMSQYCFEVYEVDGQLFFYTPGTDQLIAFTYRIERDQMM